jgi:hypothetical protein
MSFSRFRMDGTLFTLIIISVLTLVSTSILNSNGAITIDSFEPNDTNLSIDVGKPLKFSVNISEHNATYRWILDGKNVSTESSWVYLPNSTDAGAKILVVIVKSGNLSYSKQWNITVIHTDNFPKIDIIFPENSNLEIKQGDSLEFFVNVSNLDGNYIWYWWTLNGELKSRLNNWTYYPEDKERNEVKLTVRAGKWNYTRKWTVIVKKVNEPPIIKSFSPIEFTQVLEEGESLTFAISAYDLDEKDSLTYIWTLNDRWVSDSEYWTYNPEYTDSGVKIVKVVVSDCENELSQKWVVIVENKNQQPEIVFFTPNKENPVIEEGNTIIFSYLLNKKWIFKQPFEK